MRAAVLLRILFLSAAAEDPEEKVILATVQRVFDAMSAHDAESARAVLTPHFSHADLYPHGDAAR